MKNTIQRALLFVLFVTIIGCEGTPPPAPALPGDQSMGGDRKMPTAPRRVTILPAPKSP